MKGEACSHTYIYYRIGALVYTRFFLYDAKVSFITQHLDTHRKVKHTVGRAGVYDGRVAPRESTARAHTWTVTVLRSSCNRQ
jgi:hypothetical protein